MTIPHNPCIKTILNQYSTLYDMKEASPAISAIFKGEELNSSWWDKFVSDCSMWENNCDVYILDRKVDKQTSSQKITAIRRELIQAVGGDEIKANKIAALLSDKTTEDILSRVATAYERQCEATFFIEDAVPFRWIERSIRQGSFVHREENNWTPVLTSKESGFVFAKSVPRKYPEAVVCIVKGVIEKERHKKSGITRVVQCAYQAEVVYSFQPLLIDYDITLTPVPSESGKVGKKTFFGEKKLADYGTFPEC